MARAFLLFSIIAVTCSLPSSCLVKRTVTTGGQKVEEGYAIKRPVKEAINNSR